MCKIVTFTNSKNLDIKKTANKVGEILLDMERDGFGYAVKGAGGVFGEKCIDDSFKSRLGLKVLNPASIIVQKYESFGEMSKPDGAMILHGRTSTNDLGLLNCHPMIKDNHYLVHNGVVDDEGPKYKKQTTNDSEDLLHRFTKGIKQVEKHLTGYYAFCCITPDGRLTVVRDQIATLNIGWCAKYDTYIIATTKNLIEKVAKSLGATVEAIDEIAPDSYMIFDGNNIVYQKSIKSRGYDYRQARHASASLGKTLSYAERGDMLEDRELYDDMWASDYESVYDSDLEIFAEEDFKEIIKRVDDNCTIWDENDEEIPAKDFHALSLDKQKKCWIDFPTGESLGWGAA